MLECNFYATNKCVSLLSSWTADVCMCYGFVCFSYNFFVVRSFLKTVLLWRRRKKNSQNKNTHLMLVLAALICCYCTVHYSRFMCRDMSRFFSRKAKHLRFIRIWRDENFNDGLGQFWIPTECSRWVAYWRSHFEVKSPRLSILLIFFPSLLSYLPCKSQCKLLFWYRTSIQRIAIVLPFEIHRCISARAHRLRKTSLPNTSIFYWHGNILLLLFCVYDLQIYWYIQ